MPYKFRQSQVLAPSRKMVRRSAVLWLVPLPLPLRCCMYPCHHSSCAYRR